MVPKIDRLAGGLSEKRVAVLGLAFKPETDDMRDAPSVEIIRGLVERGAIVSAYDPVAAAEARKVLPEIEYAADEYEAATGAEVLVFMTEWNQFRALDMERIRGLMKVPRIADLRNIYEPAEMRAMGFQYEGVGRYILMPLSGIALVTGGAGFIGSHLAAALIERGARVRIIDDLSTGHRENLEEIGGDLDFVQASMTDETALGRALEDVELVFHEAAIPSVPRSIDNPRETH